MSVFVVQDKSCPYQQWSRRGHHGRGPALGTSPLGGARDHPPSHDACRFAPGTVVGGVTSSSAPQPLHAPSLWRAVVWHLGQRLEPGGMEDEEH